MATFDIQMNLGNYKNNKGLYTIDNDYKIDTIYKMQKMFLLYGILNLNWENAKYIPSCRYFNKNVYQLTIDVKETITIYGQCKVRDEPGKLKKGSLINEKEQVDK